MLETNAYASKSKNKLHHRSSVIVYLNREGTDGNTECLLQRRFNTGLYDGWWDGGISGGVEVGESPLDTALQEASSEVGVEIRREDMHFMGVSWIITERGEPLALYFFKTNTWAGEPRIMEPDKCDALEWFNIYNLPIKLIRDRHVMASRCDLNSSIFFELDEKSDTVRIW